MPPFNKIYLTRFYRKAEKKAMKMASNTHEVFSLLQQAVIKFNRLSLSKKREFGGIIGQLKVLFRMIMAYYNGDYKAISWKTIVKALTVIIYFLFVIDLIPDFIPIGGYLDDISLFAWVLKSIKTDLQKFEQWERTNNLQHE